METEQQTHTSVLTEKQKKKYRADYIDDDGKPGVIIATVRYDDRCGNGHNSFAITADVYGLERHPGEPTTTHKNGKRLWCWGGGCMHDEVARYLPELAPYVKWHLCASDGPMHYVANTVYHAGDKDCHGLRKGETRQIQNGRTGELCWILEPTKKLPECARGEKPTEEAILRYVPWCRIGDVKERDLDAARHSAVWPDATDEELTAPDLDRRLAARLPALLESFCAAVESLGFVY